MNLFSTELTSLCFPNQSEELIQVYLLSTAEYPVVICLLQSSANPQLPVTLRRHLPLFFNLLPKENIFAFTLSGEAYIINS